MGRIMRACMWAYYTLFQMLMALVGTRYHTVWRLARLLGAVRYRLGYIGKNRSRIIYLNEMARALPDKNQKQLEQLLKAFWHNHQANFLELFAMPKLDKTRLEQMVVFEGLEHLDEALRLGNGVILAVPHCGNERLVHIALAVKGYPIHVLSAKYEDLCRKAARLRIEAAATHHPVHFVGDFLGWIPSCLARNEIIQIAPTGEAKDGGTYVPFLNRQLLVPTGIAQLALRKHAAVVPAFDFRERDGRHRIFFEPPVDLFGPQNYTGRADTAMAILMAAIERVVVRNPEQLNWMWWVIRMQESPQAWEGGLKSGAPKLSRSHDAVGLKNSTEKE